jgi:uncharacterized protein YwgA
MNDLAQDAVLAGLVRRLREARSWGGETHVQKAAYLLRELRSVPFSFDFILYKYGPFSFELRDELAAMQADRFIERESRRPQYGPQLQVTERGMALEQRMTKTMARYGGDLDWVADWLGDRGVADLERLATAMWMTRHNAGTSAPERAELLIGVKPHIELVDAREAVQEIDRLLAA